MHTVASLMAVGIDEMDRVAAKKKLKEEIKLSLNMSTSDLENLSFHGGGKADDLIRRALLLFNVETILQSESSTARFSFRAYKKEKYDIEHIHATNEEPPKDCDHNMSPDAGRNARYRYFVGWLDALEDMKDIVPEEKLADLRAFIEGAGYEDEETAKEYHDANFREFFPLLRDSQDAISNLTLLDASTNRSYGNRPFADKRDKIRELDRESVYLPPCTRNVFLKHYTKSERLDSAELWTANDREEYLYGEYGLLNTLSDYLEQKDDSDE